MILKHLIHHILGRASIGFVFICTGFVAFSLECAAAQTTMHNKMSIDRAQRVLQDVNALMNKAEASKNCAQKDNTCCFSPIDVSQILGCVRAIKRKIEECLSPAEHDLSKAGQDAFVMQSVARFFAKVCAHLISVDEQLSLHDVLVCAKLQQFEAGYLAQVEQLMAQLVELTKTQKGEKDAFEKQLVLVQKALSDGANIKKEQLTDLEHIIEQLLKFGVGGLSRQVVLQGEKLDKDLSVLTEQLQDKQRALNGQIIGMATDIENVLLNNTRRTQDDIKAYGCTTCTKIQTIDKSLTSEYADRSTALASDMTVAQDAAIKRISGLDTAQAVQKNEALTKISNSLASLATQGRALLEQICNKGSILLNLIQSKMTDADLSMVLQMSDLMDKIGELQIDIQQLISKNFIEVDADIAQRSSELYQKLNSFKADISDTLSQQFTQFGVNIVAQFDALCEILVRVEALLTAYRHQTSTQISVVQSTVSTRLCEKMSDLTLQDRQNTNQLLTQIANFGTSFMSAFCSRLSNMQASAFTKNTAVSSAITVAQSQVMQAVCAGVSTLETKSNTQQNDVCNKLVNLNSSLSTQINNQLADAYGVITGQITCMESDINTLTSTLGSKITNGTSGLVTQEIGLINQVSQTFDNLLTDIQLENNGISTKITTLELNFLTELVAVIQQLQDQAALVDIGLDVVIVATAAAAAQVAAFALI